MTHRDELQLCPSPVTNRASHTGRYRRATRVAATLAMASAMLVASARFVAAQDQVIPPPPQTPPAGSSSTGTSSTTGTGTTQNPQNPPATPPQDNRLFFLLPNLLTVDNADHVPPLTVSQKYSLVAQGAFDVVEFPWYAFTSEISNANNSDPTLGAGWSGYGKRYTLNFVDGTSENFLVGAVMPMAFHQDPRYYRMGKGGFWRRSGYSISRIAVTRSDSGHNQVNFSEIVGAGVAAGLGNLYHPRDDRTLANTLSVWKTLIGYDTLTLVFREFWPDIRKAL